MTSHNEPPWMDERVTATHRSSTALIVLSAIAGLTVVLLAMVLTRAAEQAESVAVLALLMGTGLTVGFRRQWTR